MKYSLTSDTWDTREIKAINKVIKSKVYTYRGEYVKKFEKRFANFFGTKYSVFVNSGSSANLLSISSLFFKKENPLKRGDEVIVPTLGWSTTYHPLQQYGLKLKFVDIDLETLNVKSEDILMEDNCESMGAKINNRFTGTFGIVNTFSTFFSHHISTIEGGVITTNNKEIYNILLSLRSHGWTRDNENNFYLKKFQKNYEDYCFVLPGYNVRPTNLHAAIGLEQLKKLKKLIKIRNKNHEFFIKNFKDDDRFIIQKLNGKPSSFAFTMIFKKKYLNLKTKILKKLKKNKIEYRLITGGSFFQHPVKKYFKYSLFNGSKNVDYLHKNGFFVGNHPRNLKNEIIYLKDTINK